MGTTITFTATSPGKYGNNDPVAISNTSAMTLANSTLVGGVDEYLTAQPVWAFADGQPAEITRMRRSTDALRNKMRLTWHPRQTMSGSLVVLATAQSPLTVPPISQGTPDQIAGFNSSRSGQASKAGQLTVTLSFRDPATGKPCSGDNVQVPVPTTDYIVAVDPGANPPDTSYTTNTGTFFITNVQIGAGQITMTFNNMATGSLTLTFLQVRGYAIVSYDPLNVTQADNGSVNRMKERSFTKDLPWTNDQNFVASLVQYYANQYATPFLEAGDLRIDQRTLINGVDITQLRLMDVIDVSDVQSGMSHIKHLVAAISQTFDPAASDTVENTTLTLERMDQFTYWILGDATYGQLGVSTRLFI